MPFKDTSEGQTHSFNDGCGCPEHNQPMKNNTQESWEKEFRDKFISIDGNAFVGYPTANWHDVGNFISSLLSKQAEEISEAVEGIKKNYRCGACDGGNFGHTLGCKALKDILDLPAIKQITNK